MTHHLEELELYYRAEKLCSFSVPSSGLLIGSHPACEITIPSARCPELACVVWPEGGVLRYRHLFDHAKQEHWPLGKEISFGQAFRVRRTHIAREPCNLNPRRANPAAPVRKYRLHVGASSTARSATLTPGIRLVGSDPRCDVVLTDPEVASFHIALFENKGGVVVRDLVSQHGTWVSGMRIREATLYHGATIRVGQTNLLLRGEMDYKSHSSGELRVHSPALARAVARAERYGPLPWPVLIQGESGVGKELFASRLHRCSARANGPLVRFNAASLAPTLQEAQLFGHERGAYTGADGAQPGLFGEAHGGTLFIDEVGEMPLTTQAKLLRVLETGKRRRLGATKATPVDVRLICATHRDLARMVAERTFREDLFFRLAQLRIHVPPLRERPTDIEPLAQAFLAEASEYVGARAFTKGAIGALRESSWRGNVRELRNVVRELAACSHSVYISRGEVRARLSHAEMDHPKPTQRANAVKNALELHSGNVTAAARTLGIPRSTLRDRLRRQKGF